MSELKNGFLTAEEVMDILQIKQSKAYQIIRQLNKELSGMHYLLILSSQIKIIIESFQRFTI